MSCLDDSDDHLRWLAPTDLNLDYMGITHSDCVTRVYEKIGVSYDIITLSLPEQVLQTYSKSILHIRLTVVEARLNHL